MTHQKGGLRDPPFLLLKTIQMHIVHCNEIYKNRLVETTLVSDQTRNFSTQRQYKKTGDAMNTILGKPIPQVEWERDVLRLRLNDYITKRDTLGKYIERDEQKLKELDLQIGANIIYLNPNIYKR